MTYEELLESPFHWVIAAIDAEAITWKCTHCLETVRQLREQDRPQHCCKRKVQ